MHWVSSLAPEWTFSESATPVLAEMEWVQLFFQREESQQRSYSVSREQNGFMLLPPLDMIPVLFKILAVFYVSHCRQNDDKLASRANVADQSGCPQHTQWFFTWRSQVTFRSVRFSGWVKELVFYHWCQVVEEWKLFRFPSWQAYKR